MRKYLLLLAAAAMVAVSAPARAGYVATIGPTVVSTPDTGPTPGMADVGERFFTPDVGAPRGTTSGIFTAFANEGLPGDPVLANADLPLYGFMLDGAVTAATPTTATYGGDYAIRYYDPSSTIFTISSGKFSIDAAFDTQGKATLTGTLSQLAGPPAGTPWVDFALFGPVSFNGTYDPTVPGQQGLINGTISATGGVIPEPGSMALLAMGALPLLGLRRRK